MAQQSDPRWVQENSLTDRPIGGVRHLFLLQPVAGSAVVLMLTGALTESATAGWIGFAIALPLACRLRARHGAAVAWRVDLAIFALAAGLGGFLDAIFNVAEFSDPLTFAALWGAAALGAKKIIEGWHDRADPAESTALR